MSETGLKLPVADAIIGAARIRTEELTGAKDRDPDVRCAFADQLEAQALAVPPAEMTEVGFGREFVPLSERSPYPTITRELHETLKKPSYVSAEASQARLELAYEAGVLNSTLDISETIQAGNSIERMLAAQMAILHKATMKIGKRLIETTDHMAGVIDQQRRDNLTSQTVRLSNAVSRASAEFQSAAVTLQKLRTGGHQTVTVQHVTVKDGGQAVVTGPVSTTGGAPVHK